MIRLMLTAIAMLVVGCATAGNFNKVDVGMTKDQVHSLLGNPDDTNLNGGKSAERFDLTYDAWSGCKRSYVVVYDKDVVYKKTSVPGSSRCPSAASYQTINQANDTITQGFQRQNASVPASTPTVDPACAMQCRQAHPMWAYDTCESKCSH